MDNDNTGPKTRLHLRDRLATLFTVEYSHLPAPEVLSECAAAYTICAIFCDLDREGTLATVGTAYDKLDEHRDQILSMRLPAQEVAEA